MRTTFHANVIVAQIGTQVTANDTTRSAKHKNAAKNTAESSDKGLEKP